MQVKSLSKGFSLFKEEEGKRYLGLDPSALVDERDELFAPAAVQMDAQMGILPNDTIGSIIERAVSELYVRLRVFTLQGCSEYTRRELVSPILLAAALIAGNISLHAEYGLSGRLGNGPVDYVALYKHFCVLLTEAKQEKLMMATGQVRRDPTSRLGKLLSFLALIDGHVRLIAY
jgi:hypothetical protein